jgi:hypothetical protein
MTPRTASRKPLKNSLHGIDAISRVGRFALVLSSDRGERSLGSAVDGLGGLGDCRTMLRIATSGRFVIFKLPVGKSTDLLSNLIPSLTTARPDPAVKVLPDRRPVKSVHHKMMPCVQDSNGRGLGRQPATSTYRQVKRLFAVRPNRSDHEPHSKGEICTFRTPRGQRVRVRLHTDRSSALTTGPRCRGVHSPAHGHIGSHRDSKFDCHTPSLGSSLFAGRCSLSSFTYSAGDDP